MSKIKKAFKAVVRVAKKVVSSPLGKVALLAAGAYFAAPAILGTTATGAAGGAAAAGAAGGAAAGGTGAALGGATTTLGGAAATTTAASAAASSAGGGFFSSVGFKAASTVASLASGASSLLTSPQIPSAIETPSASAIGDTAADIAAKEALKKRKGSNSNVLTSPLGITGGSSASQVLLG